MSLLAPLFLLGLLAAFLPWWLHRLSASNPPEADFGSTKFLEPAISTSSKKRRTKYWWLLALRVLFLALLSLLFAQPVIDRIKSAGTSQTRHILLVDTSLSQSLDGRWSRTLGLANDILNQAASTDQAIVIAASDRFVQAQTDNSISSARTQLGTLAPQETRLDYGRIASAVTASVGDTTNHLHIITDTQATALPDRFTALAVDKVDKINIYSSAAVNDRNTAVTAKLEESSDGGASIVAVVNNYGVDSVNTLQVMSNGSVLATADVKVNANASLVHRFENLDLSNAKEQLVVTLSPEDSLSDDNTWQLPLPNKDKTEITIIVGNTERSVASTYAKAAIESDPRFTTRLTEADRFTKSDAGNLIIVPNASALSDRAAGRLRDYINDGGSALIAVGSKPHSSGALNLLGLRSSGLNDPTNPLAGEQVSLGTIDQSHQSTDGLASNWRAISIIRHLPLQSNITDRSIIDLSNGQPLLLEKRLGSGKVMLLATALDTQWTDLPTTSVFVAFLIKSIEYLGGDIAATSYRSTGDAITVSSGAQLLDPNGEPMKDLSKNSERTSIRLDNPGIYRLQSAAGSQAIAVNSDPRESDISTMDADTLEKWQQIASTANSNATATNTSTINNQKSFWLWLLPLLLVVALLESIYSHRHLWIRREV